MQAQSFAKPLFATKPFIFYNKNRLIKKDD